MKLLSILFNILITAATVSAFAAITPGSKIPFVDLDKGFPPEKVNIAMHVAGKRVMVVGLPGAFTTTWSSRQIPDYIQYQDAFKYNGIDEIIVFCVNDGAVMQGWEKAQGTKDTMITMLADPTGEFTRACGMELTAEGPKQLGLFGRSKRFAMYVVNNVVQAVAVAESESDPAGDDYPEPTLAPALLEMAKQVNNNMAYAARY